MKKKMRFPFTKTQMQAWKIVILHILRLVQIRIYLKQLKDQASVYLYVEVWHHLV